MIKRTVLPLWAICLAAAVLAACSQAPAVSQKPASDMPDSQVPVSQQPADPEYTAQDKGCAGAPADDEDDSQPSESSFICA